MDVLENIQQLKQTIQIRDICLRNLRIAGTILKTGVIAGLPLYHIGTIMYRPGFGDDNEILLEYLKAD